MQLLLPTGRAATFCCKRLLQNPSPALSYQLKRYNMFSTANTAANYLCIHVFVKTKPGTEEAFKAASLINARNSAQEPGVARFDVLQDTEDPTQFVLVEVYKTPDAPAQHKETAHYLAWRDTVADMMAEPRQARKFSNLFPGTMAGWDYPADSVLE